MRVGTSFQPASLGNEDMPNVDETDKNMILKIFVLKLLPYHLLYEALCRIPRHSVHVDKHNPVSSRLECNREGKKFAKVKNTVSLNYLYESESCRYASKFDVGNQVISAPLRHNNAIFLHPQISSQAVGTINKLTTRGTRFFRLLINRILKADCKIATI